VRFGIWNVRKLYRSGSHTKAARELAKYKLDLKGCRRLGGGEHGKSRGLYFSMEKKKNITYG
jgi:hypothetical protein